MRQIRSALTDAVATLLARQGIGEWNPQSVSYAPSDTAITVGRMPSEEIAQVICLTTYPLTDDLGHEDSTLGLQVRLRSGEDPFLVQDLADRVFLALHGLRDLPVGESGRIILIWRTSSATLTEDDVTGRWEAIDNYTLQIDR